MKPKTFSWLSKHSADLGFCSPLSRPDKHHIPLIETQMKIFASKYLLQSTAYLALGL